MLRLSYERGVLVQPVGLWLDALVPREISFVSHAHFDHMRVHQRVICTPATARLMRRRMPQSETCEWITPKYGEELALGDSHLSLHPAGHVLGSAMIHLSGADGDSVLYTGDFKLRESLTSEKPSPPKARQLVMETTYGLPRYVFPPTREVVEKIIHFCADSLEEGFTPILFCYALGKAQEILAALQGAGLSVALHPHIADLAEDYSQLGVCFPEFVRLPSALPREGSRKAGIDLPHSHVLLMPPNAHGSRLVRSFKNRRTAILTGWALDAGAVYRYQVDAAFPLSDHADYPDLLRLVELVEPELVHTLHGHAAEFAKHLRQRGITAWPLGEDTQQELDLDETKLLLTFSAPNEPTKTAGGSDHRRGSFALLADTATRIGAVAAKKEKIRLLSELLHQLSEFELPIAVRFLDARPLPRADQRRLQIGTAMLRSATCRSLSCTEADFRLIYSSTRDFARTVAAVVQRSDAESQGTSIEEVGALFSRLADSACPEERLELLAGAIRSFSAPEAVLFCGILTSDLRIGLRAGLVEEAIALAFDEELQQVRQAHLITGDLGVTASLAKSGRLNAARPEPMIALQPMLASALKDAAEAFERLSPPIWCELKYDGIRCQMHKRGEDVELYSRDLNAIGAVFPEIISAAKRLPFDRLILDGELLASDNGRPLPFARLQKLLGRKDRQADDLFSEERVPLEYVVFDVILCNEQNFLNVPLIHRREWLEGQYWFAPLRLIQKFSVESIDRLEGAFLASLGQGAEGLMLKNPQSPYRPGRRGLDWFKFKKELATLDCVVTAVEYGHGKRKNVLSDYTFAVRDGNRLLDIGKAYSGLTDEEIETLTTHFLARVIEKRGRRLIVQPDVVLEIAFNGIAPSKRHDSGLALRFPRIKRIRTDKTADQTDTLATARALAGITQPA